MPRTLRDIYHAEVRSPKGKRIGRVIDALFDHERPIVVGYLMERPRFLWLFDRADRHLAADRATLGRSGIDVTDANGAWDKGAASRLGIDWDETVIWSNMPARTASGAQLGVVRDARFDPATGALEVLVIGGGATADLAVGVREVASELVAGYRDGAIVVDDSVAATGTTGGAAAVAGRSAAVAKVQVEKAAKTATAYGRAAAKVAGRARRARRRSDGSSRCATRSSMRWGRPTTTDLAREGYTGRTR